MKIGWISFEQKQQQQNSFFPEIVLRLDFEWRLVIVGLCKSFKLPQAYKCFSMKRKEFCEIRKKRKKKILLFIFNWNSVCWMCALWFSERDLRQTVVNLISIYGHDMTSELINSIRAFSFTLNSFDCLQAMNIKMHNGI